MPFYFQIKRQTDYVTDRQTVEQVSNTSYKVIYLCRAASDTVSFHTAGDAPQLALQWVFHKELSIHTIFILLNLLIWRTKTVSHKIEMRNCGSFSWQNPKLGSEPVLFRGTVA